ncbi:MAG: nucleotide exchange factor GrpE [Zoogloeaceae bacterium]|jgi:molecular chaperone GrpE|nr:nucleotide exchange factor GrpE [Zoogloeaceae bacterium]
MTKNHPHQHERQPAVQTAPTPATPEVAAEPVPDSVDESITESTASVADLQTQLMALEQKLAETQDNFLRARAETENVRRRAQEDIAKAHKFGIEKFAGELLAVKDSLEAALASDKQTAEDLRGGVDLTLKQLVAAFEKSALKEINPAGEKFDPHLHQAIQMVPSDLPANTVAEVLQKGYLIAERVLRPAMVMVSRGAD